MDSALNAYYFIMAVYGWYAWKDGKKGNKKLEVSSWRMIKHLKIILFQVHKITLINWEYARINDRYFDLASIVLEFKLTNLKSSRILKPPIKSGKGV